MIKGIGIDIVDNARMKKAVERNPGIVEKILTKNELDLLEVDVNSDRFIQSLSARFAAKEAFAKSLGESLFAIGLHNIEVLKPAGEDKPIVQGLTLLSTQKGYSFHLSISHSDISAVAVVICELSIME
jgi:holo-[acyl-carrier protein] synthase